MGVLAAEALAALIVVCALAFFVAVYLRRRYLARGSDALICGFRVTGQTRWRPGLLRMGHRYLRVFPLFGWTALPAYSWARYTLEVSASAPLEDAAGLGVVVDQSGRRPRLVTASGVTSEGERMTFDLALGPVQYTTLRYWVESSPPLSRPF